VNLEDRTKVGRWLDHVSAQARKVERHQAADRATDALAEHPDLAQRVRAAVPAGDADHDRPCVSLGAQVAGAITLHQAFAAIADALQLAAQPNRQEK
jgi:predicted Zn-dependent protease